CSCATGFGKNTRPVPVLVPGPGFVAYASPPDMTRSAVTARSESRCRMRTPPFIPSLRLKELHAKKNETERDEADRGREEQAGRCPRRGRTRSIESSLERQ